MIEYHSSLRDDIKDLKELEYYSSDKGTVFYHNLEHGMCGKFKDCDAIYSEPSWVYGYKIFVERAGRSSKAAKYKRYLLGMKNVIDTLKKPTFLCMGVQAVKTLKPHIMKDVQFVAGSRVLNGSVCMIFNHEYIDESSTTDIQKFVCNKFSTVLDFSCGYGSVCQHAKKFICSDINKKCVYFVANKYLGAI